MEEDRTGRDKALPLSVLIALGLAACGTRQCGEVTTHPCLSVVAPDPEPPAPPDPTPPTTPKPAPDPTTQPKPALPTAPLRPCLSIAPPPDPRIDPEADPAPDDQGRIDDPREVRERVLASGSLPEDVVARLRR